MNLGEYFSDHQREEFANRNIDIGSAVLMKIPEYRISYEKFGIYFADDIDDVNYFGLLIINSPTDIIRYHPKIKKQHILIDCKRHHFLSYDSYVDCSKIRPTIIQEMVECISKDPSKLLGNVHFDILEEARKTILLSETITLKTKKKYSIIK